MHYTTEGVLCQNMLKVIAQCTSVKPMQQFVAVVKELTQT